MTLEELGYKRYDFHNGDIEFIRSDAKIFFYPTVKEFKKWAWEDDNECITIEEFEGITIVINELGWRIEEE